MNERCKIVQKEGNIQMNGLVAIRRGNIILFHLHHNFIITHHHHPHQHHHIWQCHQQRYCHVHQHNHHSHHHHRCHHRCVLNVCVPGALLSQLCPTLHLKHHNQIQCFNSQCVQVKFFNNFLNIFLTKVHQQLLGWHQRWCPSKNCRWKNLHLLHLQV